MALDPSTKSAAFAAVTQQFFKVDSLKNGTEGMRAARQVLLPQMAEEADDNYQTRLMNSTLVNYYVDAIDNAVGRAFSKDLAVSGLPAALTPFLADIDGSGSTLDQFGQEALWATIHHGTTYIVADYPALEVQPVTLADARTLQARPYLYLVQAPQVLAAYSVVENGQERLKHFRWITSELRTSEDGLEETTVQIVRAYNQPTKTDPITLTEWQNSNSSWIQSEPVVLQGVTEIPVVCSYGWKTGFFTGKPVLSDLADLNVAHWQSLSQQTNILSVARVPFLHVAGSNLTTTEVTTAGKTIVKPFKLSIHSAAITPENTKIEYVEVGGSAISAGADHIKYLEEKINEQSLTLSTSAPGTATATATAVNAAEAHAVLKAICSSFGQSLSRALALFSDFAGLSAPSVQIALDLNVEPVGAPSPEQVSN